MTVMTPPVTCPAWATRSIHFLRRRAGVDTSWVRLPSIIRQADNITRYDMVLARPVLRHYAPRLLTPIQAIWRHIRFDMP